MLSVPFSVLNGDGDAQSAATCPSAGVHAEQLDPVWAPVEADSRVEDQRPHVGDEEVLWLVLLHILELELWEFLFTENTGREKSRMSKS